MNIKFGMDNFYVRYLKRFLNHELSQSNTILGKFDKNDQTLLIKYLNLPNVKDMFEVQKEIIELFPELKTMFIVSLQDDVIRWTSRNISNIESQFLVDNVQAIQQYCQSVGWELNKIDEWIDYSKDINNDGRIDNEDQQILYDIIYNNKTFDNITMKRADLNLDGSINETDLNILRNYLSEGKLILEIKKSNRKNYFPNKDMLVFVNQFDGNFLYNYAINDSGEAGADDTIHYNSSGNYKIALYRCKPGQKVTIAHNSNKKVHLVIGCASVTLKQNLKDNKLQNVVEVDLRPGEGYQYTCSSKENETGYDANWLCIQCPSNYGDLSGSAEKTIFLNRGDINFDGKIDMQDYMLLAKYTSEGPGSEELHWEATDKQKAVMDINKDGIIDNKDAVILYNFINGTSGLASLGFTAYTYEGINDYVEGDNVANLLIIDGHYDNDVNIPFMDFVYNDWIIHEKFFNYLLGMAIHKYSNPDDISYIQKLLKEIFVENSKDDSYFYPGIYNTKLQSLVSKFQQSNSSYSLGDLNRDNTINETDLKILRQYLDNCTSLTDEQKTLFDKDNSGTVTELDYNEFNKEKQVLRYYLDGQLVLTPAQLEYYDFNKDGVVDEEDFDILQSYLTTINNYLEGLKTLSPIQRVRADVNQDGYIDETDYKLMEAEVIGTSNALKQYDIPFMLGWIDVQTENILEENINSSGNISEVSK